MGVVDGDRAEERVVIVVKSGITENRIAATMEATVMVSSGR